MTMHQNGGLSNISIKGRIKEIVILAAIILLGVVIYKVIEFSFPKGNVKEVQTR